MHFFSTFFVLQMIKMSSAKANIFESYDYPMSKSFMNRFNTIGLRTDS